MPENPKPPASSDSGGDTQSPTAFTTAAAGAGGSQVFPSFEVGKYRIIRLIGEGGMGSVYEARQDHPQRTVALKVIKAGLATPRALRRFDLEAQALGRLQHPGIAQIYEAGTAETGAGPQPFFAMEYVSGRALSAFVRGRALGVRERLELFARICDAVDHAHQRGVIHRDLKPANILVDESGQPKILDFGVARVTDLDSYATRQTDVGQLIGTLAYMSPEQVLADPVEIDTRSDVYALGLILYELLAGRLPYTTEHTHIHEATRAICEEEAPPLGSIKRIFRGDIEIIAAKAVEKDKARRYPSASSLAADIRRHLNDEPIVARPATTAYQLQKFARRHRALVSGVAAVFLVLVAGVLASTWQAVRATRAEQTARGAESLARSQRDHAARAEVEARAQRDQTLMEKSRADQEAATARAVNEFLQSDLLAQANSSSQTSGTPDPDIKARTLLDRAAERVAGRFAGRPLVEASIETTIGQAYQGLGLLQEAGRHLARSLAAYTAANGPVHPDTLGTAEVLGEVYRSLGRYGEAESLLEKTVDGLRRTQGTNNPQTLHAMNGLASVYIAEGKNEKAAPMMTELLGLERRLLGPDNPSTVEAIQVLARLDYVRGNLNGAENLLREAIEVNRRKMGPDHPRTLSPMNSLAVVYQSESKFAEAEVLYRSLLETDRRVRGPDHPDTFNAMNNLGALDADEGKFAEAESLYLPVLESWRKQYGPEHPRTLTLLSNLAILYRAEGKNAQAEFTAQQVLEIRRRVLGPDHPDTLESMLTLASVYTAEQKYPAAEALYEQTLEARRRVLGPKHARTTDTMAALGDLRNLAGKYAEAEPLLRECLAIQRQNAPDSAARYATESLLGQSLLHQGKFAEAERWLVSGYEGLKQREARMPALRRHTLREAGDALITLYDSWGRPSQAARWRTELAAR